MVIDQLLSRSGTLGRLRHIHQQILFLLDRQSIFLFFERCDNNVPMHLLAAQAVFT